MATASPLPSPSTPPEILFSSPPLLLPRKNLVLAPRFGAWDSAEAGPDSPSATGGTKGLEHVKEGAGGAPGTKRLGNTRGKEGYLGGWDTGLRGWREGGRGRRGEEKRKRREKEREGGGGRETGGEEDKEGEGESGGDSQHRRVSREPGRYSAAFDLLREAHSGALGHTAGVAAQGHPRGPPAQGYTGGLQSQGGWDLEDDVERDTRTSAAANTNEVESRGVGTGAGWAWGSWEERQDPQGGALDDNWGDRLEYAFTDRLSDIPEHPQSLCSSDGMAPCVPQESGSNLSKREKGSGSLVAQSQGEVQSEASWFSFSRAFEAQEVPPPLFPSSSSPDTPHAPGKEASGKETVGCAPAPARVVYPGHTLVSSSTLASAPISAPVSGPLARSKPWFRKPTKAQSRSGLITSSLPPSSPPSSSSPSSSSPPPSSLPSFSPPMSSPASSAAAPVAAPGPTQVAHPRHTPALEESAEPGLGRPQPWLRSLFQAGRSRSCEDGRVPKAGVPGVYQSEPDTPQAALASHWGVASGIPREKGHAQGGLTAGAQGRGGSQERGASASRKEKVPGNSKAVSKRGVIEKGHTESELDSFKFEPLVLNWDGDTLTGDILRRDIFGSHIFAGDEKPLLPQPLFSPLNLSPQSSFSSQAHSLHSESDRSTTCADVTSSSMIQARAQGRPGLSSTPHEQDLTTLLQREGETAGRSTCDKSESCPAQGRAGSPGADTWQRSESCPTRPSQAVRKRPVLAPKFGAWGIQGAGDTGACLAPTPGSEVTSAGWGVTPREGWDAAGPPSYSNVFLHLREYHNGAEGVPRCHTEASPLGSTTCVYPHGNEGVPRCHTEASPLGSTGVYSRPAGTSAGVVAGETAPLRGGRLPRRVMWRFWGWSGSRGLVERCATEPQAASMGAPAGVPASAIGNVPGNVQGNVTGLLPRTHWFARTALWKASRKNMDEAGQPRMGHHSHYNGRVS